MNRDPVEHKGRAASVNKETEKEITISKVEAKLRELTAFRSEGSNNLLPRVLKELAHAIANPVETNFNDFIILQVTGEQQT